MNHFLCAALLGALAMGTAAGRPALAQDGPRLALEASKSHLQGRLEQALAQFTEALRDTTLPNDRRAVILNDRGALLARLNQPKAALDDFNRAVQLYPEHAAVYNNRGSTLLTIGLPGEAIKDFDRAILLAPGYVAAFNNRANAFLLLRNQPAAVRDFTRAIELTPTAVAALAGRGQAHLAADRPQAAMRDFSRALEVDQRFALGYRNRARARILAEQVAAAVEDLSRAIAFTPTDPVIYVERGEAYQANQDMGAAIKDFTKALELSPRHLPAIEARAFAHLQVNAQTEADADIQRALEVDPRSAAAFAARALLYLRTGQQQLAAGEIQRAAKLAPTRPEVLWVRGEIDEAAGKSDAAVASYRQALVQRADFWPAVEALRRLGASGGATPARQLDELGIASWRIEAHGRRFAARSEDFPRLVVPLEMEGEGLPRLLEWETKDEPFQHIALLRFSTGRLATPTGDIETEQIAVIDLKQKRLLGIVPHRRGAKTAKWNWGDDKLVVASVDGLNDEFALLAGKPKPAATAADQSRRRRYADDGSFAPPGWIPWESNPQQRRARSGQRRNQPKTLFDMIFGN